MQNCARGERREASISGSQNGVTGSVAPGPHRFFDLADSHVIFTWMVLHENSSVCMPNSCNELQPLHHIRRSPAAPSRRMQQNLTCERWQNYNNELVKCIEDLKEKREEVNRQILQDEEEKQKIQNDLRILTERLSRINDSLARKVCAPLPALVRLALCAQ